MSSRYSGRVFTHSEELKEALLSTTASIGHNQLFLLIDLCSITRPLLATLHSWQPALEYSLLFEDTPERSIADEGPVLVQLDIHQLNHLELLTIICQCCFNDNRLIGFNSVESLATLEKHLRTALQLRWEKQTGLLRYYTPDLFKAVNMIFTPAQKAWFHQYTLQWFFMPDDEPWQVYSIANEGAEIENLAINELVFTQKQYDYLLLWADAFGIYRQFIYWLDPKDYEGKHLLLLQLYMLVCEADKAGIYDQPKLEAYCRQRLEGLMVSNISE